MANEEHLKILQQGVEVWNQWRVDNRHIRENLYYTNIIGADLSGADLSGKNLRKVDLSGADLRKANVSGSDLSEADLSGANLSQADLYNADLCNANLTKAVLSNAKFNNADLSEAILRYADLNGANLIRTNLRGADLCGVYFGGITLSETNLSETNLTGTNLSGIDLSGSNLSGANLSWSNLSGAILSKAILSKAILRWARLTETIFEGAILSNADLSGTNLRGKDLSGASLNRAIFYNAHLQTSRLINANLDGANLTGVCLWETQRAGWSIKNVICEYVFWDEKAEEKTEYTAGEFERLFSDKSKIRLFYKNGMSLLEVATLPSLIQHLANNFTNCSLRFVNMHTDSGGAVVELAIEDVDNLSKEQIKQLQAALEKEAQQQVEYQRKALVEREKRLELEGEVKQLSIVVDKLIQRPNFSIQSMRDFDMSDDQGSKYINKGQVGAMGDNAHAHNMTFNQTINTGESLDLVALAVELAQLRMAIKNKQDSSPQADVALGEIAKAEIAAGEKDESGVWQHLKAAGKYALDTATTIGTTLAAEVLKKAMGM
jgi:uncharacterized protein YjbI with pentapeptide repeats